MKKLPPLVRKVPHLIRKVPIKSKNYHMACINSTTSSRKSTSYWENFAAKVPVHMVHEYIINYLYTKTSNTNTLQSKYIALTHKRNITNSNKLQAIVLNKLWSVWTVNVLKCTILKTWIWRTARSQCFLNNMMR